MDLAVKIVLGFMAPLTALYVIGVLYMLHSSKKENSDQQKTKQQR
jgi:hypothetical protein